MDARTPLDARTPRPNPDRPTGAGCSPTCSRAGGSRRLSHGLDVRHRAVGRRTRGREGNEAGRNDVPRNACPYAADDLRRTAWIRGYNKANPFPLSAEG
ncbi:Rmf/CrpP fold protein [Streptomyces sp. NPDC059080]|uniref:Rmf/CrpP fold protein n=1 Tax=Streptomyces sp. NPDC059080 TaxID=3346718 RepID=UPI0036A4364B